MHLKLRERDCGRRRPRRPCALSIEAASYRRPARGEEEEEKAAAQSEDEGRRRRRLRPLQGHDRERGGAAAVVVVAVHKRLSLWVGEREHLDGRTEAEATCRRRQAHKG